jgi:phage shock protein PspC (stress-responsive transcriptional regulator)
MRSLNIQREPGWIGGVASGIATRLGIDPLIVRGIIVVVAILGGPALLVYAAAWLLLPDLNDKIHLERVLKGDFEPPVAGIGLLVLLALLPVSQGFWFAGSAFWGEPYWGAAIGRALWTLVILGLAVWLVIWIARQPGVLPNSSSKQTSPAPAPPAANAPASDFAAWREQQTAWKAENIAFRQQQNAERAAAFRSMHEEQRAEWAARQAVVRERNRRSRPNPLFSILVIGLALIAGGLTTLSLKNGEIEVITVVPGLCVALAVLALGMIVNGAIGKRPGGAAGVAWLVVIPLIIFTWLPQNSHLQYGYAQFAPVDQTGNAADVFFAAGGDVDFELADYYDNHLSHRGGQPDNVYLFVLAGDVTVDLPAESYSTVNASVLVGGIQKDDEGLARSTYVTFNEPDGDVTQVLSVHVYVLTGTITINTPEEG